MAGELWRSAFQIGKETTPGTAVAATRKMYFKTDDSRLMRERAPRAHRFATGTRDNVRAFTLGPVQAGGNVALPLSASEIIELLLITVAGGVTPTGAGAAKLWTFTPSATLDSATVEWHDGARAWRERGVRGAKLSIQGNVREETTVTAELMGLDLALNALTSSLTERVPDFIEGWETKLFIDAFGGTPGGTNVAGTLINWAVEFDNHLMRKFFADNTNAASAVAAGELGISATLTFEASASAAASEFANWDAATKRIIRLEFGQNEVISGSDKKFVTLDIPGAWEAVDLGGSDEGTRTYELKLQYVYDPTNGFGFQVRAQNARSTAF